MHVSRILRGAVASAAALSGLALGFAAPAGAATATACSTTCVLDARTGAHPGYDRLVLDLSAGSIPTASVFTSDGTYTMASGNTGTFAIPGSSYLMIQIVPLQTFDDAGHATYTTPAVDQVGLTTLKGVQLTSAYEGYVEFGISLNAGYTSYHVSHLTAPNRLIVDFYG